MGIQPTRYFALVLINDGSQGDSHPIAAKRLLLPLPAYLSIPA